MEFGEEATGAIAVRIGVHELDDAVGLGIGERLEQDGVDDGEDGGVGSDAEGESGDGRDGERRSGDERAEGVAQVAEKVAHDGVPPSKRSSEPGPLRMQHST